MFFSLSEKYTKVKICVLVALKNNGKLVKSKSKQSKQFSDRIEFKARVVTNCVFLNKLFHSSEIESQLQKV